MQKSVIMPVVVICFSLLPFNLNKPISSWIAFGLRLSVALLLVTGMGAQRLSLSPHNKTDSYVFHHAVNRQTTQNDFRVCGKLIVLKPVDDKSS